MAEKRRDIMSTTTNFSKIPNSLVDGEDKRLAKIKNKNAVLVYLSFTNTHLEFLQWSFSYPEIVEFCKTIGIKTRIRMLLDDLIKCGLISYDEETATFFAPDIILLQDETMQRYRNERYAPHARAKKSSKLHAKKLAEWEQHPRPQFVETLTGRPTLPYNTPRHNVSFILDSVVDEITDMDTDQVENPLIIIDPPEALPTEPELEFDSYVDFVDEMNEANPFHLMTDTIEKEYSPKDLNSPKVPEKKEILKPPRMDSISQDPGRSDPLFAFADEPTPVPRVERTRTFERPPTKEFRAKQKAPTKLSKIMKHHLARVDAK